MNQPLIEHRDYSSEDQLEKNFNELDSPLKSDDLKKQFKNRTKKIALQILADDEKLFISQIVDKVVGEL